MRSNITFQVLRTFHTGKCYNERLRPLAAPLRIRKATKTAIKTDRGFVDWIRATVQAGNGGDGGVHMSSLFANEFAGPGGGDGGNGGHVLFRASKVVSSLGHLKREITAPSGQDGNREKMEGKAAEHKIIDVPLGTIFRNAKREVVAEVVHDGAMFLAARGGAGGKGNFSFRNSVNRAPRVAEKGGIGEKFVFTIEMKTMAHVGLIGFPNAGKSTLLRAISRARSKVAAYPFTTLNPHVGMVPYEDNVQLAVADLPGLIPGAHKNRGLGISFLRHIERCACLLYVIDMGQVDAYDQLKGLKYELEQYSPGLSKRPHGLIANKMDLERSGDNLAVFKESAKHDSEELNTIIQISGKHGDNIGELLHFIRSMYDIYNEAFEKTIPAA